MVQAAEQHGFEVKFLVRLPACPTAGLAACVAVSRKEQARLTNQQALQGESSTHGNSSNPDASGDDHQT
jgi:hypothetical protein